LENPPEQQNQREPEAEMDDMPHPATLPDAEHIAKTTIGRDIGRGEVFWGRSGLRGDGTRSEQNHLSNTIQTLHFSQICLGGLSETKKTKEIAAYFEPQ